MYVLKLVADFLCASPLMNSVLPKEAQRPVVFWHGMGDSYNSSAMQSAFSTIHSVKPELSIYSVYIDPDDSKDQQASVFGNVNEQVEIACSQIRSVPGLNDQPFDFIGFSQGGVFARAAIERCGLDVHTLITFGSPHAGVSDLPRCDDSDWLCKQKNSILKRQVWRSNIQRSVVAAQYFRDPLDYENYLQHSAFLVNVNNELEEKNQTYVENFETLEKLVLIMFDKDETLVPKESAWFYDQDETTGETIPFQNTKFYKDELIGLQKLSLLGKVEFMKIDDRHMSIGEDFLKMITEKYLGL